MPLSVAKKLSLGELTPTIVTLQMADRTMAKPEGVIEDVLVKVGKFIFPVDFIILDMEEDSQVPLLLGRPFLATGAALINMQKGVLTLRVGEEAADFNLLKSLKNVDTDREDYKLVDDVYLNNFIVIMIYADAESNGSGEKEQTPGRLQQFIGKSDLKKGSTFLLT